MNGTGTVIVSSIGLAALAFTLTNWLRFLVNIGDKAARAAFVAQAVAFAVTIGVVFLAAADTGSFGRLELIDGEQLHAMSAAAKVLVGLMLGGTAGVLHKVIQARDNSDSAAVQPFVK